jgi:hypothetical protein
VEWPKREGNTYHKYRVEPAITFSSSRKLVPVGLLRTPRRQDERQTAQVLQAVSRLIGPRFEVFRPDAPAHTSKSSFVLSVLSLLVEPSLDGSSFSVLAAIGCGFRDAAENHDVNSRMMFVVTEKVGILSNNFGNRERVPLNRKAFNVATRVVQNLLKAPIGSIDGQCLQLVITEILKVDFLFEKAITSAVPRLTNS